MKEQQPDVVLSPPEAIELETITMLMYSGYGYASDQEQMNRTAGLINEQLLALGLSLELEIVVRPLNEVRDVKQSGIGYPFLEEALEYDLFLKALAQRCSFQL